jgi:hypothetical protein
MLSDPWLYPENLKSVWSFVTTDIERAVPDGAIAGPYAIAIIAACRFKRQETDSSRIRALLAGFALYDSITATDFGAMFDTPCNEV